MRIIGAVLEKEWNELRHNRTLIWSTFLPAIMFVAIPLFIITRSIPDSGNASSRLTEAILNADPELVSLDPAVLQRVAVGRQFLMFQMITPVMVALSIATYSIIGEKQLRSLEPLLATPITSLQLIVAKSLAAAIPAMIVTWAQAAAYAAGLRILAPEVFAHVLNSVGIALVLLVHPLVVILGLSIGVIVSSRMNDPRSAQQIGGLVILPLIALMAGQLSGLYLVTLPLVLMAALVIGFIDVVVFGWGIALFDRETILTRWK